MQARMADLLLRLVPSVPALRPANRLNCYMLKFEIKTEEGHYYEVSIQPHPAIPSFAVGKAYEDMAALMLIMKTAVEESLKPE